MKTISQIAEGDKSALTAVENELKFLLHGISHSAHSELHRVLDILWLLPETEERNRLQEQIGEIAEQYSKVLDELHEYSTATGEED